MVQQVVFIKALVFDKHCNVLLIRRSETAPRRPLQWDLPGGFVDDEDESYQQACLRELREEAGMEVTPGTLRLGYAESAINWVESDEAFDVTWLYFTAEAASTEVKLSYEHDKSTWVSLERALELITYDKQLRALAHIQQLKQT